MAPPTASTSTPSNGSMSDLARITSKRCVAHRDKVRSLSWNCDGRRLASGSADKTLRIWVPEKDVKASTELKGHTAEVSGVRWDPTHPEHLASCSASMGAAMDKGLYFWDIRQGKPTAVVQLQGENINMTWSPDGKTIVVGNRADVVLWVDVETKTIIKEQKMTKETNESLFSHNGSVLFNTLDGNVSLSTFPGNEPVHTLHVSPVATTTLDLDPRGRYLAAGSNDALLTLWETRDWTCVRSMGFHDEPIRIARFSHDGQYLASTSGEPEVIISEVPTGKKLLAFPTGGPCDTLAWHPTRHLLAYAGNELENGRPSGTFRIWGL